MICLLRKFARITKVDTVKLSEAVWRCSLACLQVSSVCESCSRMFCISANSLSHLSRCCEIRWRALPDTTCE